MNIPTSPSQAIAALTKDKKQPSPQPVQETAPESTELVIDERAVEGTCGAVVVKLSCDPDKLEAQRWTVTVTKESETYTIPGMDWAEARSAFEHPFSYRIVPDLFRRTGNG